jgi:hypothetical protein
MPIDLHIEHINIHVTPDTNGGTLLDPLFSQLLAGVSPDALKDYGYKGVPDEIETSESISPEDQTSLDIARAESYLLTQEDVDLTARSNFLRNVVANVDLARKREGFQTNHQRLPRNRSTLDKRQAEATRKATESLDRACGVFALRGNCALQEDIGRWIDVHPYKRDTSGKKRPGSGLVKKVESRATFLRDLRADPTTHCDPSKRKLA